MMIDAPFPERPEFVLIPMGSAAEKFCAGFIADLRRRGVYCDMGYRGNLKKRLQRADVAKASYAILVGDDELAAGEVTVRSLKSGEQARRSVAEVLQGPAAGRTVTLVALTSDLDGIANRV
jgi:histidyl-tRNA synthetase